MEQVALARGWMAFDRLPPDVRERLAPLGTMTSFSVGDTVLHEGRETPFLGWVERGRIALRLRVPELGERVTIGTIEPGELLGWSAIVAPFRATVDAVATEPARIVAFPAAALRGLLEADDELAAALLPLVLESVARRVTTSWHQLLDLFAARRQEPW